MVAHLMRLKIRSTGLSDIGLVRHNNEDVWEQLTDVHFYVLADGMGGHQAGEIAARETVNLLCKIIKKALEKPSHRSLTDLRDLLTGAIQNANEQVYRLSRSSAELKGMGTTLCCLHIHDDGIVYANVGDSRIYRFREGKLEQITQDHSLLSELVEMGQISEQSPTDFLYKNILTKAIGTEASVDPYVAQADIAPADIFLLCTDGLSDLLSKTDIELVLAKKQTLAKSAKELVALAKTRGGHDNVTVILVKAEKQHVSSKDLSR